MEFGGFVAEGDVGLGVPVFAGAELAEVFRGQWVRGAEEVERDAA